MKKISVCLMALTMAAVSGPAIAGKVYRGNWGGDAPTSLEIRTEKPLIVRYCFRGDCNLHEPSGNQNRMTIRFPRRGDFPGATLKFKKSGNGYDGTYRRRGESRTYRATLR